MKRLKSTTAIMLILCMMFSMFSVQGFAGELGNPIMGELFLTEICPNDIPRNETYTGLSKASIDSMDYFEVYNASDEEVNFASDFEIVYTYEDPVTFTFLESDMLIPAKSAAVFWVRRVDLEKDEVTMPMIEDFRSSMDVPDDVPVFCVSNQTALKNSSATISIVSKSTGDTLSTYQYTRDDAGAVEGSSVQLRAVEGEPSALAIETQAMATAGRVSEIQKKVFSQPQLSQGSAERTGISTATVTFYTNQDGVYYYSVVESGESVPTIETSEEGISCEAGEQTIELSTLTDGAKDIYLIVKNQEGVESLPYQVAISGFFAPSSGDEELFLTEIYPNDIPRNETYTELSKASVDIMDYFELYNASDEEVDFASGFDIVYTDGDPLTFTFLESDMLIPAKSTAVFWVRRVDLEEDGITMPTIEDFRSSMDVPDDVPVFSVTNQKALRNTTATISIVSKSTGDTLSTYQYAKTDAGSKEGSSVQLRSAEETGVSI